MPDPFERRPGVLASHLGWLLVLAIWIVFAAPLWRADSIVYLGDLGFLDVPLRVYAGRLIRSGEFPVWTDELAGGIPLFSESQTGLAYPPSWLFVLYPSPETSDWLTALHYLVLGVGLYLLSRQAGAGRIGAGIAASLQMTCWGFRAMHCAPAVMAGFAWMPLSLWLIGQARSGWKWALWCSAATVSFVFLAGGPLIILTVAPTCCVYWLYKHWNQGFLAWIRGVAILTAMPILLAAIQVIPLYSYFRESNRRELSTHALAVGNGVPWSYFAPWGLLQRESQNLEEPLRDQWPSQVVYACSAAAMAIGLTAIGRRPDRLFWLGLALVALAASVESPLLWLVNSIPPFSMSRFPGFYLIGAQIAACLFVALGFSRMGAWGAAMFAKHPRRGKVILALSVAALLGVNWRAADMSRYLSDGPFYSELNSAFAADIATCRRGNGHVRLFAPQSPASLGSSDGMWRESQWRQHAAGLAVDYNLMHGVPSIDQYDLLDGTVTNSRLYWFSQLLAKGERNAFRAAAVTHVSLPPGAPAPAGYDRIAATGGNFFRSPELRPPAWMVFDTEYIAGRDERCIRLTKADFDPYRTAIVETPTLEFDAQPAEPPSVTMVPKIRGRKEFDVSSTARGLLVISNTYYSQLRAHVDGVESQVLPVNQAFCGVVLPPGKHRVVLSYSPHEIYLGLAVSIVTWAFVVWRIVVNVRASRAD